MADGGWWKEASSWASILAVLGTLAGATATLFMSTDIQNSRLAATEVFVVSELEQRLEREISELRSDLEATVTSILEDAAISEEAEVGLRFRQIDSKLAAIERQLLIISTIETAVTENPERAMSIPILRRDVDAISSDVSQDLSTIRLELDRVYDLGKWFLGLIATMALGVLGLAVGNLLKGKD